MFGLCWNRKKSGKYHFQISFFSHILFFPHIQVPEKLLLSACHLTVSITSTVRPVFLVTLPAVQNIFNLITTESQTRRLPQEVNDHCMVYCFEIKGLWGIKREWKNEGAFKG